MGLFGNVGKASFAGRNPFFPQGFEGLVEIREVSFYESKNPDKEGTWFFKISGVVQAAHYAGGKVPEDGLLPGQTGVHLITLGTESQIRKASTPAMGDVKAFAEAVWKQIAVDTDSEGGADGVDSSKFGDAEIDPIYGPSQVAAGLILGLKTSGKETKKEKDFTQHFWTMGTGWSSSLPPAKS